jgi:hypothetical protein
VSVRQKHFRTSTPAIPTWTNEPFEGGIFCQGQLPHKENRDFLDLPENLPLPDPPTFKKIFAPCIFEGHFFTNPILSAFHFQGSKSNIYIHFR